MANGERETERLSALHRYRILDAEPECRFDDLAMIASHICDTPMALITLVDGHRQWSKSRVGISVAETSRAPSFCQHAIQQRDLFIIPDTLHDERFCDNPQVTGHPSLRFYAGAPNRAPSRHRAHPPGDDLDGRDGHRSRKSRGGVSNRRTVARR